MKKETDSRLPGIRNRRFDRILVVRTDRIGDVILSLPVLTALRKRYPRAELTLMADPYVREIVEDHPAVDRVIWDGGDRPGAPGFRDRVRTLRRRRFDAALLLHPTLRLAGMLFLAGIPVRVGTAYRAYSPLFNVRIREHRKTGHRHEAEFNLSQAAALGADPSHVDFAYPVTDEGKAEAEAWMRRQGLTDGKPVVILHPGSRGSALEWPAENFQRLACRLLDSGTCRVVLTGGGDNRDQILRMAAELNNRVAALAGDLGLKALAALIQRARGFIANSTGPLHIAAAVGTEVIGLYPPVAPMSARRWGPYGQAEHVLIPPVAECRKCTGTSCARWNCMDLISVDTVYERARLWCRD